MMMSLINALRYSTPNSDSTSLFYHQLCLLHITLHPPDIYVNVATPPITLWVWEMMGLCWHTLFYLLISWSYEISLVYPVFQCAYLALYIPIHILTSYVRFTICAWEIIFLIRDNLSWLCNASIMLKCCYDAPLKLT